VFRLLSWNVLADAHIQPRFYPRVERALLEPGARTRAIIEHLAASGADVACLQEVEPALVEAIERAGGWQVHFVQKRRKPDGCAVLARLAAAVEDVRTIAYADGAPDRASSGHVALIATVRVGGDRCRVATTHVKWDAPATPMEQRWAVRQVRELLREIGDPADCVACGDFNVEPADAPYAAMLAAGFADPCPHLPTANPNGRAKRIDHLLCGRGLRATPWPILTIDNDTPLPSLMMPSDHIPIGAAIEIAPEGRHGG
jgi:mRNA deadenylase 3'-5' endonuclease subunit Ccr4